MKMTNKDYYENDVRQIVVVCFGTPNISGDALGPIVGSLLINKFLTRAFVYGTLENPINGKNMLDWVEFLSDVHKDAIFIAVDASLGAKAKIGHILMRKDGVCPAAVKGEKKRFGDIGILGVVGESKGDALMELMQVSSIYIDELANKVAFLLNESIEQLFQIS